MMEDTAVTIEEIRVLVAERQRFDDWLTALDSRRAETPVRVFERVYADYVARRNAVISNLHEHVGSLESLSQDLGSKLHALEVQLSEREDERSEAMLRTAVGEFDTEKWETTRHEVEASIEQLGKDREALVTEAEDARALLLSARQKPVEAVPAEPESANEQVPEVVAVEEPVVQPTMAQHEADADIETAFAVSDDSVEPLVDAVSVPAYPIAAKPVAAVHHPDADRAVNAAVDLMDAAPGATVPESLDTIDVFGESSVPARAASDRGGARHSDTRTGASSDAAPSGTATRDSFDDLAFLRSVTESGANAPSGTRANGAAEQTKTLRCTECGTMNFPTEWYCERCGGELAAF